MKFRTNAGCALPVEKVEELRSAYWIRFSSRALEYALPMIRGAPPSSGRYAWEP